MNEAEPRAESWEQHIGCDDQLSAVEKMGRESIGDAHPSVATLARRRAINPEILRVFGPRLPGGPFELRGYSILYPLTDEAGEAIVQGRICSGSEIEPESLLPTFAGAKHLYIGMLLGTADIEARVHAKLFLRQELARRISEGTVESVFARPATAAGKKLMRSHDFTQIADEQGIWSIPGEQLMKS